MANQSFEVEENATLSVTTCQGDLTIQGWSRNVIRLQADSEELDVKREGNTLMVSSPTDLRIDVPHSATIRVQNVTGDARFKRIQGTLSLGRIEGDLVLSRVNAADIQHVSGDVSARVVDGDLSVQAVKGDMSARKVGGRLEIGEVGRDLGLRELMADSKAEQVQGDIRLKTAFTSGKSYRFKADGDLVARVPPDTDADLTLRSRGKQIQIKAPLVDRAEADGEVTGRLGEGGAEVELEAGRDLVFVAREDDWGAIGADIGSIGAEIGVEFGGEFASLAEEIAEQVQAHMDEMSAQLEAKLSSLEIDMAAIDTRAAQAAQRATERARKEMERAAERLRRSAEREADKVRRKASKIHARASYVPPGRPAKETKTGEPVSDKERMAILNMLAEGKISIEEAESLLEALKG